MCQSFRDLTDSRGSDVVVNYANGRYDARSVRRSSEVMERFCAIMSARGFPASSWNSSYPTRHEAWEPVTEGHGGDRSALTQRADYLLQVRFAEFGPA